MPDTMFKVTFINVPCHDEIVMTVYPPVGILSMSAGLKKAGHHVSFIDADVNRLTRHELLDEIRKDLPDLIGISLNVSQVKHSVAIIDALQTHIPDIPIVLGGPYISGVREGIFADFPTLQFAVVNEGEEAIVDFVDFLRGEKTIGDITNLMYKKDGEIILNARSRIKDLDALPLPDYSLVSAHLHNYPAVPPTMGSPSVAIMCTQGCPYKCSFCSSPVSWNRKVTFRKTDSVIKEILHLRELIDVREVYFQDDTLNARPKWLIDLCDKIIEHGLHKEVFFKCALRVNKNLVSMDILKKLKEANFCVALFGVESGNQEMLHKMHKNITIGEIKRAFRLTRKAGLSTTAAFMIGNDGETKKTIQDSFNLMKKIKPDYVGFSIASPFPGSELHRIATEKGHITCSDFKQYQFGDTILRTEELDTEDLIYYQGVASSKYYKMKQSFAYRFVSRKNLFNKMVGEGFFLREPLNDTWMRRTMKYCSYALPTDGHAGDGTLFMKIAADYPDISDRPVKMKLSIDGKKHSVILVDPTWREVKFPVFCDSEPFVFIKWKVNRTWNPSRGGTNNDDRELGISVEDIWLS